MDRKTTLAALVLLASLAGCSTLSVDESVTAKHGGGDADAQMEFWHQLHERKVTSNDDALHGVLLFVDGKDDSADYAARVNTLKQRGLLPASFDRPPNDMVRRGDLAVIIVNALKIKRGLFASLMPDSDRYAMRELQYTGIYPPGSPWQGFTGSQFVSIIGRLEDYQRTNPTDLPAKQIDDQRTPDEPGTKEAPVRPTPDPDKPTTPAEPGAKPA